MIESKATNPARVDDEMKKRRNSREWLDESYRVEELEFDEVVILMDGDKIFFKREESES